MHPNGQIIRIMGQYTHHINGHINEIHAIQGNKRIKIDTKLIIINSSFFYFLNIQNIFT